MSENKYPELKDFSSLAKGMGEDFKVEFVKTDVKGIYYVKVLIGGNLPDGVDFFSFDKKKIYNFYEDYPHNLTEGQIKLVNKLLPALAELNNWGGYPPENEKAPNVTKDSAIKSPWDTRF